jgi:hypothetical protein
MHEYFVNKNKIAEHGEDFLKETYDTTLTSLSTAFALATALAWNDAIKMFIQNVMPNGKGHTQLLFYAIFVTVLYALFIMLTRKKQKETPVILAKIA